MFEELAIPFDPLNPGQFYACCGLQTVFDAMLAVNGGSGAASGATESYFAFDRRRPRRGLFHVRLAMGRPEAGWLDVGAALRAVEFEPAPRIACDERTELDAGLQPFEMVVRGAAGGNSGGGPGSLESRLRLNWWCREFEDRKTPFKGWAGQVTPEKLFTELPRLVRQFVGSAEKGPQASGGMPMDFAVNTKTKFGIDPRSAWEPRHIGFSPDKHKGADVYPVVEVLGAIGLQMFRPAAVAARRRFYRYRLWLDPLPAMVAASAPWEGLESVEFEFEVGTRGRYAFFDFASLAAPASR